MSSSSNNKVRTSQIAMIAAFLAVIVVFFLLICFLPKHEGELSPNERRMLAKAPDASLSSLISGNFATEVDTWLQDHFPARNFFVSLYSYLNRYTGRNATESIIMGKGDRLFNAPTAYDEAKLRTNGGLVKRFAEDNSLNTTLVIIPSSGYMLEDELPKLHLEYDDGSIVSGFSEAAGGSSIPVGELFSSAADVSSLYYRTDHHLTMQGSYLLYQSIAESLGFTPLPESEFSKRSFEFYGTSYGSSGLMLTKPDSLEVWTADSNSDIAVTTIDGGKETAHSGMIDESCLEDGVVDRYAAYLYSNHGITVIENPNAEGGTLLVLKDSYGNAIVPFLANHYSRIVMLDVRYFNSAMPLPSELCSEYGIEELLVIYGVDTAQTTGDLVWLR